LITEAITIDARMLTFSGIGTYLMRLLTHLASMESEFNFEVICREPELLSHLPSDRFRFIESKAPIYSLREQWEVARLVRGACLLHCPHYNIPFIHSGKLVVTIHDLNHLLFPEFLPNRSAYFYARLMIGAAVKRATNIVTDSQFSKHSIQERFNVPDQKIRVIYPGLSEPLTCCQNPVDLASLHHMGVQAPYVLFVGLLKPHKNVGALIRAFGRLPAEIKNGTQLVIAGRKDSEYPRLEGLVRELALESRVIFAGHVTDADLQALYSCASVLALVSLNEGFGLPALEAMAFGVPVVVSNTSSLPEVAGSAGILVDPRDEQSIALAIGKLLSDSDLRQTLSERGRERARLFSARKSALDHLEVYRAALGS
jgi:glycosyltransferase involved in cell wall biosynthesis